MTLPRLTQPLAILILTGLIFGCSDSVNPGPSGSPVSLKKPEVRKKTGPRREAKQFTAAVAPEEPVGKDFSARLEKKTRTASPAKPKLGPPDPVCERISGYKTPAEYFSIKSENYDGTTVVTLPMDYYKKRDKRYPLVIVFGGATECAKEPRKGALAWMRYYKTDEAIAALRRNKLESEDFRGLATPSEVGMFNRMLKEHPYDGMILACPSSPPVHAAEGPELPEYEEYIMNELLPALKKRYRVADDLIGVDGVSMGGARSIYYGLKYPEVFSAIGGIQGFFTPYLDLYDYLVKINADELRRRKIQLVTSDKDPLNPSNERMHMLLKRARIPHEFHVLTGPHDYIFNQGPGAISLLVFHDRSLRTARIAGPSK
jgi:iron(III)-salmochelin esterase